MTIEAPGRTAFLVAGMHRTGTSAFAGTLHCLGLAVPTDLMSPDAANANGYYESFELARIHNRILRTAGARWDDWSAIEDSWFGSPASEVYAGRILRFLGRNFAGKPGLLIKDPRICRLLPLWLPVLQDFGARANIVLPLRHPDATASSLIARDGFLARESHLLWLRHLLDAERATRALPRAFVLYDDLLDDWRTVVDSMMMRLGCHWPRPLAEAAPDIERFLDRGLRHHRPRRTHPGSGDQAEALAYEAWSLFGRLARGKGDDVSDGEFDRLRARLDAIPSTHRLRLRIGLAIGRVGQYITRVRTKLAIAGRGSISPANGGE